MHGLSARIVVARLKVTIISVPRKKFSSIAVNPRPIWRFTLTAFTEKHRPQQAKIGIVAWVLER